MRTRELSLSAIFSLSLSMILFYQLPVTQLLHYPIIPLPNCLISLHLHMGAHRGGRGGGGCKSMRSFPPWKIKIFNIWWGGGGGGWLLTTFSLYDGLFWSLWGGFFWACPPPYENFCGAHASASPCT